MLKDAEEINNKVRRWTKLNEIQIKEELKKDNPLLPRPKALNMASGRYNIYKPVPKKDKLISRLHLLNQSTYDEYINDYSRNQVVLVMITRNDNSECRKAEQLLQLVYGELIQEYEDIDKCPYRFAKYDLSEGNFIKNRFNISGIPLYNYY